MSNLTNYGENKIADFLRGQGLTLPTNWYLSLASAASESGVTELTGTGLARQPLPRSLANFAGTQGPGTTLASTGTSHATSNNIDVSWGTPGSDWGTAAEVGFHDALTAGNCWLHAPLPSPIVITTGSPDPVEVLAGELLLTLGLISGCSDYLANKLIDKLLRDQTFDWPATLYQALYSAAPTNAGGGTELAVAGYARKALVPGLSTLSGTQSVGSTSASSGTGGRSSNNAVLTFAAPITATVVAGALMDASTSGNMLLWSLALDGLGAPTAKSLSSSGPAPSLAANKLGITVA